jgi:quinol monooxygenase YgiN
MITVVAKTPYLPGTQEAVLDVYETLVAQTRKEPGCRAYDLFQDVQNPETFTMIETWEDRTALDRHLASPAFLTLVEALRPHAAAPAQIDLYHPAFGRS